MTPTFNIVQLITEQRAAFTEGALWARYVNQTDDTTASEARRRYPMPTVDVPRVVKLATGIEYRFVDGRFQAKQYASDMWMESAYYQPEEINALAELMERPTERKPADEIAQPTWTP